MKSKFVSPLCDCDPATINDWTYRAHLSSRMKCPPSPIITRDGHTECYESIGQCLQDQIAAKHKRQLII